MSLAPDIGNLPRNEHPRDREAPASSSVPRPQQRQFGNANGNYDQRRAETNASINPMTNGSGGANQRVDFEGHNNQIGRVKV